MVPLTKVVISLRKSESILKYRRSLFGSFTSHNMIVLNGVPCHLNKLFLFNYIAIS